MSSRNFTPIRNQLRRASKLAKPENLQFPIEDNNHGVLLVFKDYEYVPFDRRNFNFPTPENARTGDTIFLPLPATIQDANTLRISRFEQGLTSILSGVFSDVSKTGGLNLSNFQEAAMAAVKEALPTAMSSGTELANVATDIAKNLMGRGEDGSVSLDRFSSELAFAARRYLPGDIGRAVDAGTGTYINPKAALSFEGVEMKRHSLEWTLSPKSPAESVIMQNIIRTIKKKILPSYVSGEISSRVLFRYPSLVDIFFVGLDQDYYFHYKSSMVDSFSVDYTPEGMSVLKGGRPAATRLQLQFTETDIHTAEDYGAESFTFNQDLEITGELIPTTGTNSPIGSTR
jgi:hypothetical protein